MYNIIALILTTIFVPLISLLTIKYYGAPNSKKVLTIFTLTLLGCELLRFFYNASLYEKAVTPANALTFSFITMFCIVSLFATFVRGGIFSNLTKTICVFTCLMPLVVALFNSKFYTNSLDTYAVTKALYFIESGLAVTMALLYIKFENVKLSALNMLWSILFVGAYVLIDLLIITIWETGNQINLMWGLSYICSAVTVALIYLANFVVTKIKNKKQEQNTNGQ